MGVTHDYSAIHDAFKFAANGYTPFTVRVAVALDELGPTLDLHVLERTLRTDGAAVRRAALEMYAHGLATGEPRRRGCLTKLTLTSKGRGVVSDFWSAYGAT